MFEVAEVPSNATSHSLVLLNEHLKMFSGGAHCFCGLIKCDVFHNEDWLRVGLAEGCESLEMFEHGEVEFVELCLCIDFYKWGEVFDIKMFVGVLGEVFSELFDLVGG